MTIGQAYSINPEATYPYKPPRYGQFGEGGKPNKTTKKKIKTNTNFLSKIK